MSTLKNLLALGMVFSLERKPKVGQEYRDRVRLEQLEKEGYIVYTLDDKHESDPRWNRADRHCRTTISNVRYFKNDIESAWGKIMFDCIVMDYFFSPVSFIMEF